MFNFSFFVTAGLKISFHISIFSWVLKKKQFIFSGNPALSGFTASKSVLMASSKIWLRIEFPVFISQGFL